jgi:hypothetical protein
VGLSVLAVPALANGRVLGDLYRSGDGRGGRDGRSLQVVGLTTDGRLVSFDAATPGQTRGIGRVKGLAGDQSLAGTTAMDGTLTVPPATTPAMGVGAAADTNDDLDPSTATTLFDLDAAGDQVVIQSPANAGALAPTGKLLVDTGPGAGAGRGVLC